MTGYDANTAMFVLAIVAFIVIFGFAGVYLLKSVFDSMKKYWR